MHIHIGTNTTMYLCILAFSFKEERQAASGGFQPLLALAGILQRISDTRKAESAMAAASEADDVRELGTQEDNAVT